MTPPEARTEAVRACDQGRPRHVAGTSTNQLTCGTYVQHDSSSTVIVFLSREW